MTEDYDVIVVGAGLVGLATSALLAQQGARVLTIERRASTSIHPKARLVTVRSMEIYRALGIEDEVRNAGEPNLGFHTATTLADTDSQQWIASTADDTRQADASPTTSYSCDQQRLEPILLRRARALGAVVRFDSTASLVVSDPSGASLELRSDHDVRRVDTRFVVAADGAHSGLRQQLGIAMPGESLPGEAISAVFRADLSKALRGREIHAIMCRRAEAFLFARGNSTERRWQIGTYMRPEWRGMPHEELRSRLGDVIRAAAGLCDLDVEIEDTAIWRSGARTAERLCAGSVFLVGDAAHVMPPYGGLGGNTGVGDAHNLAWKLAAVRAGRAPKALLDSYERERLPIDRLITRQALLRSRKQPGQPPSSDEIDATTLALGLRYPTDAPSPTARHTDNPDAPTAAPGTRAPHIRLTSGASTLDYLDPQRLTLVGPSDTVPADVLHTPAHIRCVAVSREDIAAEHRSRWRSTYSHPDVHGLLIRPDGIIGARIGHDGSIVDAVNRVLSGGYSQ